MATNVIYNDGDNLSLPVAADTASGDPVLVGANLASGLVGVALTAEGEGGILRAAALAVVVSLCVVVVRGPLFMSRHDALHQRV